MSAWYGGDVDVAIASSTPATLHARSAAALSEMAGENAVRLEALMEALERHYIAGDYAAIGDSAVELQYFSKIEEEISLRMDEVG